jgi:glycosyltransferase involved in cell wall biosynthesis
VIVPVRQAMATIRTTLADLLAQECAEPFEIVAVVSAGDPTAPALAKLRDPRLRVIVASGSCGVPQLRRDGVASSSARFIAITEDHCRFPEGWIRDIVAAIEAHGVEISGGPVGNQRRSLAGWAQYFTRYSSFMPPMAEGLTRTLAGNNACYRREVLLEHAELLRDGFWEAEFNHALLRAGCRMWIAPSLEVGQRQQRGLLAYIPLRYRHGRCYGARREKKHWLGAPLIPALLYFRAARAVFGKRRNRVVFLTVSPLVLVYMTAWAVGEIAGYLFGAGRSCLETD